MQIICFRLHRIGKYVSQSKTRAVIFAYGTTWKAHTWFVDSSMSSIFFLQIYFEIQAAVE